MKDLTLFLNIFFLIFVLFFADREEHSIFVEHSERYKYVWIHNLYIFLVIMTELN